MLLKSVSLVAAVIVTSCLMAAYLFDDSVAPATSAVRIASSRKPFSSSLPATDCMAESSSANPFAVANRDCKQNAPDTEAIAQQTKEASSIGKTLRELNACDSKTPSAGCSAARPAEAKLVERLEDMNRSGDSQARFELAMHLQRQEQRSGRALRNEADIAQDTNLQRAVALVAEAAAAGNSDAQRLTKSMENGARLFHTGR